MLSVDEALENILSHFHPLQPEPVPIALALGRVLAQDIQAGLDLPPFDNSGMDGFAVRVEDVAFASRDHPVTLPVVADIPAGSAPTIHLQTGQAARILTGAPVPIGADAVVPVEDTDHYLPPQPDENVRTDIHVPREVAIYRAALPGEYIRRLGEDIRAGETVLKAGRLLRAADIGVAVALGYAEVMVFRRPVIAIISTGDELIEVDEPLEPGKIRDTNGYTITALAQKLGARAIRLGIARDRLDDVAAHFQRAVDIQADLIISTAGVSVGAYDVVKQAVEVNGALNFWKVNMRPGKPLVFGNIRNIPFFGLPGNPVSAMVTFDVFVRPALLRLCGRSSDTPLVYAELNEPMQGDGRRTYARVTLKRDGERLIASSTGNQGSNVLTSLVHADGLLIMPEGMTHAPAGTRLPVRVFAEDV